MVIKDPRELFDLLKNGQKHDPPVLMGLDLRGADMRAADFKGAVFYRCILSGADLREARLSNAMIINSRLSRADFSAADMAGTIISGRDMDETPDLNALAGFFKALAKEPGNAVHQASLEQAQMPLKSIDLSSVKLCGARLAETQWEGGRI